MKHMKKIVALVLAMISVVGLAVPAMAASSTGRYNDVQVAVRGSIDASSYRARVAEGTTCDILDFSYGYEGKKWYQVKITSGTHKGTSGWSMAEFIDVVNSGPELRHSSWEEAFGLNNLEEGSSGVYVRNLQKVLWTYKYLDHYDDYAIDGQFGSATKAAVIEFQKDHFSSPADWDGIVGDKTKEELFKYW